MSRQFERASSEFYNYFKERLQKFEIYFLIDNCAYLSEKEFIKLKSCLEHLFHFKQNSYLIQCTSFVKILYPKQDCNYMSGISNLSQQICAINLIDQAIQEISLRSSNDKAVFIFSHHTTTHFQIKIDEIVTKRQQNLDLNQIIIGNSVSPILTEDKGIVFRFFDYTEFDKVIKFKESSNLPCPVELELCPVDSNISFNNGELQSFVAKIIVSFDFALDSILIIKTDDEYFTAETKSIYPRKGEFHNQIVSINNNNGSNKEIASMKKEEEEWQNCKLTTTIKWERKGNDSQFRGAVDILIIYKNNCWPETLEIHTGYLVSSVLPMQNNSCIDLSKQFNIELVGDLIPQVVASLIISVCNDVPTEISELIAKENNLGTLLDEYCLDNYLPRGSMPGHCKLLSATIENYSMLIEQNQEISTIIFIIEFAQFEPILIEEFFDKIDSVLHEYVIVVIATDIFLEDDLLNDIYLPFDKYIPRASIFIVSLYSMYAGRRYSLDYDILQIWKKIRETSFNFWGIAFDTIEYPIVKRDPIPSFIDKDDEPISHIPELPQLENEIKSKIQSILLSKPSIGNQILSKYSVSARFETKYTIMQEYWKENYFIVSDQKKNLFIAKRGSNSNSDNIILESVLLSSINHPNILKFIELFVTEFEYWIIMEHVEGIQLSSIRNESILELFQILYQISSALDYLATDCFILHYLVSEENILLNQSNQSIYLIDCCIPSEITTPIPFQYTSNPSEKQLHEQRFHFELLEKISKIAEFLKPNEVAIDETIQKFFNNFIDRCKRRNSLNIGWKLCDISNFLGLMSQLCRNDVINNYKILGRLGRGTQGIVYKCQKGDSFYAIKKCFDIDYLLLEVQLLSKCAGFEHIIQLEELFLHDDAIHVVTEFIDGNTLGDFILNNELPTEEVEKIVYQITKSLCFLHNEVGIVHRDIKPDNIMITRNSKIVKTIDLGLATIDRPYEMTMGLGTPAYIAPEALSESYSKLIDIWSLGITCLALLRQEGLMVEILKKKQDIENGQCNIEFEGVSNSNTLTIFLSLSIAPSSQRMSSETLLQFLS